MAGWVRADVPAPTSGAAWRFAVADGGGREVASFGATGRGVAGWDLAGLGPAASGGAPLGVAGFGMVGLGVAGSGAANWAGAGVADARLAVAGSDASEVRATWRAAAGPGAAGFEGAAGGAGICTVGFFAAVVVFAGKDALTLLDEASTAVVGSVG